MAVLTPLLLLACAVVAVYSSPVPQSINSNTGTAAAFATQVLPTAETLRASARASLLSTPAPTSTPTSAPTYETGSTWDENTYKTFNIYYITAVCAGIAVFIILIAAGMYRYKIRQQQMMTNANGLGNSRRAAAAAAAATTNSRRPRKKRVVLTEDQFNMLSFGVAQGSSALCRLSGEINNNRVSAKEHQQDSTNVTYTKATTTTTKAAAAAAAKMNDDGNGGVGHGDSKENNNLNSDGHKTLKLAEEVDGGSSSGSSKEPETCAVCLDDICSGDNLVYLICNHAFHVDCARPWFLQKSTLCPLCKKDTLEGLGLDRHKSVEHDDDSDDDDDEDVNAERAPETPSPAAAALPGDSSQVTSSSQQQQQQQ